MCELVSRVLQTVTKLLNPPCRMPLAPIFLRNMIQKGLLCVWLLGCLYVLVWKIVNYHKTLEESQSLPIAVQLVQIFNFLFYPTKEVVFVVTTCGIMRMCLECHVNCHRRCKASISNLCGVNQKILNELLEMVRTSTPAKPNTAVPPSSVRHFFNITLIFFTGK